MSSKKVEAIVYTGPGRIEIQEFALPALGKDQVLVKTQYTTVSTGTELRVLAGHYGAEYPLIPGYSAVGEIVEIGEAVTGLRAGDFVSMGGSKAELGIRMQWGGQSSYHIHAPDSLILLPHDGELLDYTLVDVGAIPFRGAEAAQPKSGETALVIGQGLIGALSAAWLQMFGCRVIVVDTVDGRLDRAREAGAAAAINAMEPDVAARILAHTDGAPEIVVECSGSIPGLKLAYQLIARNPWVERMATPAPKLVLQANYLDEVTINPFSFFQGESVHLITPIDRRKRDRAKVAEAIRSKAISPRQYIDRVIPFREAPEAYLSLRDEPGKYLSLIFDWRET